MVSVVLVSRMSLAADPVSIADAYSVLSPSPPRTANVENPSGIAGRVLAGYQGWFRTPEDGSEMGFHHYSKNGKFEPGFASVDLWPDLAEFSAEEKVNTPFFHKDGSRAQVFSSLNAKTVNRHFKWMQEHEIDGAFIQRFGVLVANNRPSQNALKAENRKLMLCREAANSNGRAYALMYDLSGMKKDDFAALGRDWTNLRERMDLGKDANDQAYLMHNGKPLVAIWGIGFDDGRDYSLDDVKSFIHLVKDNPEFGGMSVMLGVPYGWRDQVHDTVQDDKFHEILKLADIISPWSVGRYSEVDFKTGKHIENLVKDREWCEKFNLDYFPVVFPGFSWHNLTGEKLDKIPRRKGKFLWDQFIAVRAAGIDTAYVAMFDEIDEGTAIFKCTNNPPVGENVNFLTYDGMAPDHYLRVTQKGRSLLRGELLEIEHSE